MDFGLLWPREPLFYSINADGMMINNDETRTNINNGTTDSLLSSSSMTTTAAAEESNEAIIGSLENAYQQYQFVSMMEGLFQTIDATMIHQPNNEVSMVDPLHRSVSVSDLPSSSSGNEFFDQGLTTNPLPLFRSSSLLSSISAAKDLSIDHSSLDTLYGFAPLSAAFQDAY